MNAEATVLRERTHTRTRTGGASARSAKTQPGSGGVAFATQVMTVPLRAVTRPAGRRLAMATGLSLLLTRSPPPPQRVAPAAAPAPPASRQPRPPP